MASTITHTLTHARKAMEYTNMNRWADHPCITDEHANVTRFRGEMETAISGKHTSDVIGLDFSSWYDFVQFCKVDPHEENHDVNGSLTDSTTSGAISEKHFKTFGEAVEAAENGGWPQGTKRAMKMLDSFQIGNVAGFGETFETKTALFGGLPNVGAYAVGDPYCFTQREWIEDRDGVGFETITVNVNVTAAAELNNKAIARRGAAAYALVMALEKYGFAVNISVVAAGANLDPNRSFVATVNLRKAGEYLNPDVIAFALCNPDAERRFFFRLTERLPRHWSNKFPTYGLPADWTGWKNDGIYMGAGRHDVNWNSKTDSLRWIKEKLEEQGISADL